MKPARAFLSVPLVALAAFAFSPRAAFSKNPSDDEGARTQAAALEVARFLSGQDDKGDKGNVGFKIRDGHWASTIAPGEPKIIQVNLYAGNRYWFAAAPASPEAGRLTLGIYDETGRLVLMQTCGQAIWTGAGFTGFDPTVSGPYYLRIALASQPGSKPPKPDDSTGTEPEPDPPEKPPKPDQPSQPERAPVAFYLLYSYK